jgi:sortase (surface protein transpeptidase)
LQAPAVHSARLADARPIRSGPRPVGLRIPAIGVDAIIEPVGVIPGVDTVEVPSDVDRVGWYRFGPSPGAPGSAVLLGHVDSRTQGPGAFLGLRDLARGDVVSVRFADGTQSTFLVAARRSYPKDRLPAAVFERTGRPTLALVTCGGAFDEATRTYSDNVVVFAVPRR